MMREGCIHIARIQLHQTKGGEQFILPFHNFSTTKCNERDSGYFIGFPSSRSVQSDVDLGACLSSPLIQNLPRYQSENVSDSMI